MQRETPSGEDTRKSRDSPLLSPAHPLLLCHLEQELVGHGVLRAQFCGAHRSNVEVTGHECLLLQCLERLLASVEVKGGSQEKTREPFPLCHLSVSGQGQAVKSRAMAWTGK